MKYGQEWAETLILRILNDPTYSDEFVKVISNLDKDNKSAVINLLEKNKDNNKDDDGKSAEEFIKNLYCVVEVKTKIT